MCDYEPTAMNRRSILKASALGSLLIPSIAACAPSDPGTVAGTPGGRRDHQG
jgi:hypothetical protein